MAASRKEACALAQVLSCQMRGPTDYRVTPCAVLAGRVAGAGAPQKWISSSPGRATRPETWRGQQRAPRCRSLERTGPLPRSEFSCKCTPSPFTCGAAVRKACCRHGDVAHHVSAHTAAGITPLQAPSYVVQLSGQPSAGMVLWRCLVMCAHSSRRHVL